MEHLEELHGRIEADRRDLLDLSLRNPLLNYRARSRGLEFVGESPHEIYRLLVREGKALSFLAAPVVSPVGGSAAEELDESQTPDLSRGTITDLKLQTALPAEDLQTRLLAIYYAARTAIEEQGVNTLFLALGLLSWQGDSLNPGPFRAPLVLVPVCLVRSSVRDRFRLRHDGEDLDINLSLAEKLRVECGLTLPDLPDTEELDVDAYFSAVAEAVRSECFWTVDRSAVLLGFFSFGKFLMYRDLDAANWPEDSPPARHPVIRSLLGDGFVNPAPAEEDDPAVEPLGAKPRALVLDADQTQRCALSDVADGRHLVIQGPPGTGKSQTITNLIADAIGRGQTVLFVAEKLAALEVVKRRLDAIGLGEACLELHSHNAGKKAVLDQLRRTLCMGPPRKPAENRERALWSELSERLDAYCDAINAPIGESGVTPHHAIGEALRMRQQLGLEALPPLDCSLLSEWGEADFRRRLELVERFQDRLDRLGSLREHPYFGCRRASWQPADVERLHERLTVARHATATLREASSALTRLLNLQTPTVPAASDLALRVARALSSLAGWRESPLADWPKIRSDVHALIDSSLALAELRRCHEATLVPEAWGQTLEETRRVLNQHGGHWWRFLSPTYRRACRQLQAICRSSQPKQQDQQLALLDALAEARRLRSVIASHEALKRRYLGEHRDEDDRDWLVWKQLADETDRVHQQIGQGHLPRLPLEALPESPTHRVVPPLVRAVEAIRDAHRQAIGRVLEFLEFDETARFGDGGGLAEFPFLEQEGQLEDWMLTSPRIHEIRDVNELANRCRHEGMAGVCELAESWPVAAQSLGTAFHVARYEALVSRACRERPLLSEFDGLSHDRMITAFRKADRLQQHWVRSVIAWEHWRRVPRHEGGGQLAALRRELAKKARHLPVRQLMARAGRAVQAAKPVFMMSPLSIAAYLPPGALAFDLVVFDEASQVRPVDALGSLLRGQQAVVVGDSRQLPPTSFFDRLTMGEDLGEDDEPTSEVESILGLFAAQGAPERLLRWHYRSRHESLIAVSNREFYDDRLIIFPSPDAGREHAGLVLHHLPETVYDRGGSRTNPREADAVAEAVLVFARTQLAVAPSQRRSLGVATFSSAQMKATLDRIERLRRADPATEPFFDPGAQNPFFVKNLENVQGDERDVIFISVGYGRAADGSLSLNFGPLNTEGGERRLNVLITRARVRCEVFTNLIASDLDPTRIRARGVQALRSFLGYAQTGGWNASEPTHEPSTHPMSAALGAVLTEAGYPWRAQVGVEGSGIDLAVMDPARPTRYLMGIASDGPSYGECRTARDRDRLRPEVLEGLGWRLLRAWTPDWHRDFARQRQAMLTELKALEREHPAEPMGTGEAIPVQDTVGAEEPAEPVEATSSGIPPYRFATLEPDANGPNAPSSERLSARLIEVVRVESPVHFSEVTRRLIDGLGARRLGPRLLEAIGLACDRAVASGSIQRRGDFLWWTTMDRATLRDRSLLPAASRKLDLVDPEEITEAITRVASDSFGIEADQIAAAACRLLGFSRVSDEMKGRVGELVEQMTRQGRLVAHGCYLVVAEAEDPTVM